MNVYRKKALDTTPAIYLTLMSIIQGLVLTYFADHFEFKNSEPSEVFIRLLMYCVALQMIVVTWHEYAVSTICFSWSIGFPDTWIPILLGLSEYSVVKYASFESVGRFWIWLTLFVGLGVVAFLNRERQIRITPENEQPASLLANELRETRRWLIGALAFFVAGAIVMFWGRRNVLIVGALLGMVNICFIFQAIRCCRTYRILFAQDSAEIRAVAPDPTRRQ